MHERWLFWIAPLTPLTRLVFHVAACFFGKESLGPFEGQGLQGSGALGQLVTFHIAEVKQYAVCMAVNYFGLLPLCAFFQRKWHNMVPKALLGFEPRISCLQGRCLNQLSHSTILFSQLLLYSPHHNTSDQFSVLPSVFPYMEHWGN